MISKNSSHDPVPSEDVEQMRLFRWARYRRGMFPELDLMYAVPNGGFRHIQTARRMRATGTKAGVPDICLPVPRGGYHGMYIEMKRREGGRLSDKQRTFLNALEQQGYFCTVCEGWEAAAEKIDCYLMFK